ncbi:MAG: hypothetical protein JW932_03080 [Deltaproteobacteria bacterium]|nr:hypothetical protein [Deltaproteobacteria bacterium]
MPLFMYLTHHARLFILNLMLVQKKVFGYAGTSFSVRRPKTDTAFSAPVPGGQAAFISATNGTEDRQKR